MHSGPGLDARSEAAGAGASSQAKTRSMVLKRSSKRFCRDKAILMSRSEMTRSAHITIE